MSLRKSYIPGRIAARRGFSLVELVVSVGVLVLLLAMAGQVMNLTVTATGQAQAIANISQQLRILEQVLRSDLAAVDRQASVMLIQSNPINAYWTQDGADADDNNDPSDGYPHEVDLDRSNPFHPERLGRPRADVLMFFVQRESSSNVHENVRSVLQQVVYGHADFGNYNETGQFVEPLENERFPDDFNAYFDSPSENWLLARRNVLLSPVITTPPITDPPVVRLDDERVLRGETDVVEGFNYEQLVLHPDPTAGEPQYLPPIFRPLTSEPAMPYARSLVDRKPPPQLAYAINHQLLPNCASFKVEWSLDTQSAFVDGDLDEENQVHWIDMGALWDLDISDAPPESRYPQLASFYLARDEAEDNGNVERGANIVSVLADHRGTSETAPYNLEERFGSATSDWVNANPWLDWPDGDHRRQRYAVFCTRRGPQGEVPDDVFPRTLRITVEVYDEQRRLDRPVRHVMVLPVGPY